ncbi:hypothetical protein AHAS_AhasUnG0003800 [Arachis hypogaea]
METKRRRASCRRLGVRRQVRVEERGRHRVNVAQRGICCCRCAPSCAVAVVRAVPIAVGEVRRWRQLRPLLWNKDERETLRGKREL